MAVSKIELSTEAQAALVDQIRRYMASELDIDLGRFDAEFLLAFVTEKLGPHYYNRGLSDAQALFQERMDTIAEAIYCLEKPT